MRRPERAIAAGFAISILSGLGLAATYVLGGQPQIEGALLALALGGIGVGLVVWGKWLLPPFEPQVEARPSPPTRAEEDEVGAQVEAGMEQIRRRKFLSRLLLGAAGALGLAALFPIRSLGRAPRGSLFRTPWRAGLRLVTAEGEVVTRETLQVGSFTTVFPEGDVGSADGQAVLVRVEQGTLDLPPRRLAGAPEGYVAYSKVCTHAGCPIGLYLAETNELRCPCHQSTFDVLRGAEPVYGPAARPLPQLLLEIDAYGALRATGDFTAPVGPAFWNLPP